MLAKNDDTWNDLSLYTLQSQYSRALSFNNEYYVSGHVIAIEDNKGLKGKQKLKISIPPEACK